MTEPDEGRHGGAGWGSRLAIWMAVGVGFGAGLGAWLGNSGVGIAIGIAASVVLGALVHRFRRKGRSTAAGRR